MTDTLFDTTRILKMQATFKHAFAIFYNISTEEEWNHIQRNVCFGSCRLLAAQDLHHALENMLITVMAYKNTAKLSRQRQYFTQVT